VELKSRDLLAQNIKDHDTQQKDDQDKQRNVQVLLVGHEIIKYDPV
jgi:hypothetical protein